MELEKLTLEEIKQGYYTKEKGFCCIFCGKEFAKGEVFPFEDKFYDAERGIVNHIKGVHGSVTEELLHDKSKNNTLTDKQKELMILFASGLSDKEIAKQTEVSFSTIRHQRFTFKEKAKQAKFYLALYESVFQGTHSKDNIVPISGSQAYYDDRYMVTEEEKAHILETSFSSFTPLKLEKFSPKAKKKVIILERIAQEFQRGRTYSEKEVNSLVQPIYDDYITIRRYLIMYGFMERTADGRVYKIK